MHRVLSFTLAAAVAVMALAATPVARASIPVYVMLPLDAVTNENTLKDPTGLKSQLQTLASTGAEGVMGDVWWGLVEQQPQQYNFSAYQQLVDIVASVGLKYQAVMSFHQCGGNVGDACDVPLPSWVRNVAAQDPAIFYTDAEGHADQEYISLFVDEMPMFGGRTPVQLYQDFVAAYAGAMSSQLSSGVIDSIEISMGPAGELRYPSYQLSRWNFCGVGEFQCYGKHALESLADAASAAGHSDWGTAGPSNAGNYNSHPGDTGFFGSGNENYQSDYGQFFLGWYSQQLLDHADRVLGAVSQPLSKYSVKLAGKVSGIHWWYKDPSHAAELTAGYFNTDQHNAYADIAKVFAKHGADFDFTCMEMQDSDQPSDCACGPFELVQQAKAAAHNAGTGFAGENALPRYDQTAYNTIEQQATALGYDITDFTYLRLGDTLLQGGNLGTFKNFVQALKND